jgi:hypothetical protein
MQIWTFGMRVSRPRARRALKKTYLDRSAKAIDWYYGLPALQLPVVSTSRAVWSGKDLSHLRLMTNTVLSATRSVLLNCMFQDRVTNFFCRLILVFTDYLFDLQPVLHIAAIVDPVCIKEEDVSRTHERDFRHVG